jgi:hypothetical protein
VFLSKTTPLDKMTPALPGGNCIATDHREDGRQFDNMHNVECSIFVIRPFSDIFGGTLTEHITKSRVLRRGKLLL